MKTSKVHIPILTFLISISLYAGEDQGVVLFQKDKGRVSQFNYELLDRKLPEQKPNSPEFFPKAKIILKKYPTLQKRVLKTEELGWNVNIHDRKSAGWEMEGNTLLSLGKISSRDLSIDIINLNEKPLLLNQFNKFVFGYELVNYDPTQNLEVAYDLNAEREEWENGLPVITPIYAHTINAPLAPLKIVEPHRVIIGERETENTNLWLNKNIDHEVHVQIEQSQNLKDILAIDIVVSPQKNVNPVGISVKKEKLAWGAIKLEYLYPEVISIENDEKILRISKSQILRYFGDDYSDGVIKNLNISFQSDENNPSPDLVHQIIYRKNPSRGEVVLLPKNTVALINGKKWLLVDLEPLMKPNSKLKYLKSHITICPLDGQTGQILNILNVQYVQSSYVPISSYEANSRGFLHSLKGPFLQPEELTKAGVLEWVHAKTLLPFSSYSFPNYENFKFEGNEFNSRRERLLSLLSFKKNTNQFLNNYKKVFPWVDNLRDRNLTLNTDGYFQDVDTSNQLLSIRGQGKILTIDWAQMLRIEPQSYVLLASKGDIKTIMNAYFQFYDSEIKFPFRLNEPISMGGMDKNISGLKIVFEFNTPSFELGLDKILFFTPEVKAIESTFTDKTPIYEISKLSIHNVTVSPGGKTYFSNNSLMASLPVGDVITKLSWSTRLASPLIRGKYLHVECDISPEAKLMQPAQLKLIFNYDAGSIRKELTLFQNLNSFSLPFSELIPPKENVGSLGLLRSIDWDLGINAARPANKNYHLIVSAKINGIQLRSAQDDFRDWSGIPIISSKQIERLIKDELWLDLPRTNYSNLVKLKSLPIFSPHPLFSLESIFIEPENRLPHKFWCELTSKKELFPNSSHVPSFLIRLLLILAVLFAVRKIVRFKRINISFNFLKNWNPLDINMEYYFNIFVFYIFIGPFGYRAIELWSKNRSYYELVVAAIFTLLAVWHLKRLEKIKPVVPAKFTRLKWLLYLFIGAGLALYYSYDKYAAVIPKFKPKYILLILSFLGYLFYPQWTWTQKNVPKAWRAPILLILLAVGFGSLAMVKPVAEFRDGMLSIVGLLTCVAMYYATLAVYPMLKQSLPLLSKYMFTSKSRTLLFLGFLCFPLSALLFSLSYDDLAALPSDLSFYFILMAVLLKAKQLSKFNDQES